MIKILFKILKYALILYFMVFIKNLYSETFEDKSIITVSMPNIIDIDDLEDNLDDTMIFAEKMYRNSDEYQQALAQQQQLQQQSKQKYITANSYRKSLEHGLTEEDSRLIQDYNSLNRN